jgi:type VI secretion system protein ImpE
MNEAKEKLNSGDLQGAIESLIQLVKQKPTDSQARIFLFELSLFSGEWERAERQLEAIGQMDIESAFGAKVYQQCIVAERKRGRYFSESLKPEFVTEVPEYIYGLLNANNYLRDGNSAKARELLDEVEEKRPAFLCEVNGKKREDFRDYNDLTSCVMEIFIRDSYVWVPFEQILAVEFAPLRSLRDLFWRQARIMTINGTNGEVFVPGIYSNSWQSQDTEIRLGKATDWKDAGNEVYIGQGQKIFFDGEIKPMFEIEKIVFGGEDISN